MATRREITAILGIQAKEWIGSGQPLEFETIIGLEVHAQVSTRSKMFSACSADTAHADANTRVDPVSLGMPGTLPVVNRAAVEKTVMTGIALNCEIPQYSRFDRKNYMYPDLMKGYQISQYELPLAIGGQLEFELDDTTYRVGITRVHLEEDTAKLMHVNDRHGGYSLVDVNRAGVPLMEIVSEPDLRSPAQARQFLITLRQILRYIGSSSGNMEEGALRVDANVSQRSIDGSIIGPKVEVKNMNSFRSVERALQFEVERQRRALADGEELVQETRGWVEDRGVTVSQRGKEFAEDYRYFPEPDLPPLEITADWLSEIKNGMAELPSVRRQRFVDVYELTPADAATLTEDAMIADYYEDVVTLTGGHYREAAHWVSGELFALARTKGGFEAVNVPASSLAEILSLVDSGEINLRTAKDVLSRSAESGESPRAIVDAEGLAQISDTDAIRSVVESVIQENPQAVEDYRAGKQAAIGFLIGQSMRQLRGAGNPDVVRSELIRILSD